MSKVHRRNWGRLPRSPATLFLSPESEIWRVPATREFAADMAYDAGRDQPSCAEIKAACEQVLQSDLIHPGKVIMCRICNGGLIQGAVTLKSAYEMPQENVYRNLVAVDAGKKMEDACPAPQHRRRVGNPIITIGKDGNCSNARGARIV